MDRVDNSEVDVYHDVLLENFKQYYSWILAHIQSEKTYEEIRNILFCSEEAKSHATRCVIPLSSVKDSSNKEEVYELLDKVRKKLDYIDSI